MEVPDVFQTAFQTAPLDLGTVVFYPSRRGAIDTRLSQVRGGQGPALLQECWQQHVGQWCRGVNWDRHGRACTLLSGAALLQQLAFGLQPKQDLPYLQFALLSYPYSVLLCQLVSYTSESPVSSWKVFNTGATKFCKNQCQTLSKSAAACSTSHRIEKQPSIVNCHCFWT